MELASTRMNLVKVASLCFYRQKCYIKRLVFSASPVVRISIKITCLSAIHVVDIIWLKTATVSAALKELRTKGPEAT